MIYYQSENIALLHGDCIELMKRLPDKSFDAVITDPPYGTTACKWDSVIPFAPMWEQLKRIIKPNGAIVLFGSQPFTSALIMSNPKMFKYEWVWEKNNAGNFQLVNHQPLKIHETISVFCNETHSMEFADVMLENMKRLGLKNIDVSMLEVSRTGRMTGWVTNKLNGSQLPTPEQWNKICGLFGIEDKYREILNRVKKMTYNLDLNDTDTVCSNKGKAGTLGHLSSENKRDNYVQTKTGYPKSILRYDRENGLHPTQKPVAPARIPDKTYTNEGETVLDFTAGSGTTGVAAINTGRNAILIERELEYCETAKKRIEGAENA